MCEKGYVDCCTFLIGPYLYTSWKGGVIYYTNSFKVGTDLTYEYLDVRIGVRKVLGYWWVRTHVGQLMSFFHDGRVGYYFFNFIECQLGYQYQYQHQNRTFECT